MSSESFFEKLTNYLRSCCPDSCVMLIDNLEWKLKAFLMVETMTPERLSGTVHAWRRVSFCTGDAAEVAQGVIAYIREMQDNEVEEFDCFTLPDPGVVTEPEVWLSISNRMNLPVAIKKSQITHKPFVMVDLDLKDQADYMREHGFIPGSADSTYLMELEGEKKKELVNRICDLNLLVTETEPSLILFTGGGIHVWYALPEATDGDRYTILHRRICDRLKGLFPGLIFDPAANQITQNLRLPYTYNGKYNPEIPCELLYEAEEFTMAPWIQDIHNGIPETEEYQSGELMTAGSFIDYSVEGALNIHSGREIPKKLTHEGLRNFRRDPRMWEFIQRYLTFEAICSYTNTELRNMTRHNGTSGEAGDYYILCSSPFRRDEHPSFMAFNSGLYCQDKGLGDKIYDFGVVMRLLLIAAKKKLGFIDTDTTRYEADFHCIFAAYLNYIQLTRTNILPMLEMGSTAKKREGIDTEFDPKLLKKGFVGKNYYCNLQVTLENWVKLFRKEGKWNPAFMRTLFSSTPDIYYFFDAKQNNSGMAYLAGTTALCVIHYFNQLNLGIRFSRPGKFQLYVVNTELQLHEDFSTWVVGHTMSGAEDENFGKTRIHTLIVNTNMSDAGSLPKGTSRLCDHVAGVLLGMTTMDKELGRFLPDNVIPDENQVKAGIVEYLTSVIVPGAKISSCDLKVSILDDRRYIEFDNCLVLYATKEADYDSIGSVYPKSDKTSLLRRSVVDLRIPHRYTPGKDTPMFDRFVEDMTYENNAFDRAFQYFTASLLYSPRLHPGKVWYLLGRDGDNGKSVIGTIVSGLLGPAYTTTKDLSDLTATTDRGKNTRNELVHSLLNVTQDSSRNKLEGVFKSLIEGEPVSVRALYQKEYDVCLPTHYMVNANSLPATWGETQPLVKRIILTRVDRVVPKEKRIDDLGNKIIRQEADGIWPKIIEQAPVFLSQGLKGFFGTDELETLNHVFYEQNDVFTFVNEYIFYDKTKDWHLSGKNFKVLYNKYRTYMGKQVVASDNLISEAESFIRKIYLGQIADSVLEKGFTNRTRDFRGLPLRVYVAPGQVGNYQAIDSQPEGTEPPAAVKERLK